MILIDIPNLFVELKEFPKISVIILTKNKYEHLFNCLESIKKQNYPNLKIYVGDTGSNYKEFKKIEKYCLENNITLIDKFKYDFSKNNNEIVRKHIDNDTELLLFCNNDIEIINNAIMQMVKVYLDSKDKIGTIGSQLFFLDGTIQHQGVFIQQHQPNKFALGHIGINTLNYNFNSAIVFANTGAFLMISKKLFDEIGGFSEKYESVFQDIELNVECLIRNKANICMRSAICYHDESTTRNDESNKQKIILKDLESKFNPYFSDKLKKNELYLKNFILR